MPGKGRFSQLRVLWGVLGICLTTVGCQAQFSFLGGPLDPHARVTQEAQASQGPAPAPGSPSGASPAAPSSPSLTVPPLLPPMPNRQSAPNSSGGLLGGL